MARIRMHGNLAGYAPLALVLLLVAEIGGARPWALHTGPSRLIQIRKARHFPLARLPIPLYISFRSDRMRA